MEAIPGDILASAVGDESLEDSCALGPPSVRLRAKVSDLYDALYQDGSSAEGWTVEAADILLLGHSERDKRGGASPGRWSNRSWCRYKKGRPLEASGRPTVYLMFVGFSYLCSLLGIALIIR